MISAEPLSSLPFMSENAHSNSLPSGKTTSLRTWFWLIPLAHFVLLWWLWLHDFPQYNADGASMKGPVYMRLYGDRFSAISWKGSLPHYEKLFNYPAPISMYANLLVFRIAGCSLSTSVAFDLLVHFTVCLLLTWAVFELSNSFVMAAIAQVGCLHLMCPLGRPEELGLLFLILAFVAIWRSEKHYLVAMVCLALCGATAAATAVAGMFGWLTLEYEQFGLSRRFIVRSLAILLGAPFLAVGIYLFYLYPYISEGFEQMKFHLEHFYYSQPLEMVFSLTSLDGAFLAIMTALTLILAVWSWRSSRAQNFRTTMAFQVCNALAVMLFAGIAVNILESRPRYDYRATAACEILIVCIISANVLRAGIINSYWGKTVFVIALLLLNVLPNSYVARCAIAAMCWGPDAKTFNDSREKVLALVPPTASIGGEGALWAIVDHGRPFFAVRWTALKDWPDYLISTTWAKDPYVLQESTWREKIEREYEEIGPLVELPADGCACGIKRMNIKVANGRCDWEVRIWKKRPEISTGDK